jgi:Surface glycan-binding protein B xyloglucan binding domain/IPT/TIG domain
MKNISFNSVLKISLFAAFGALTFMACEKNLVAADPVAVACSGAPTMSSVTMPTKRDTVLKEARMTDWIIVKGTNLCTPTALLVNDVAVNIAEVSASGNEFTFKIPKALPKTQNNKITFTNGSGTATFDFKVIVPDLSFTGYGGDIEEYTPVGQNLIIKGQNFDLYGYTLEVTTVLFGTTSVKPTKVTDSEVHVTIPAGTAANTAVKVKNATLEKEVPIRYKDTRGVIYDLDPMKEGWTPTVVSSGPTPGPVSGNYCVMTANYKDAWGWQEDMHIADMVKLADFGITAGTVNRYVVKFEVNVPTDWTSNPFRLWWKSKSGTFNYNFPWGGSFDGKAYKTAGWKTVTIPLEDFYYSEDDAGAKKGQKVTTLDAESINTGIEMRLFVQGPDVKKMNLYWDNFRIVPKY